MLLVVLVPTPTITASGFVGTNNATHVSSTWQIAFTPTFGSSAGPLPVVLIPVLRRSLTPVVWCLHLQNDINNKTSVTIASGILEEGKTYYARVRYEYYDLQNTYWYSEWSEPIYFNTVAVPGELQCPSVASVIKSTIYDRMDVTTSPFIATPASTAQTHVHSDWQVATDAEFNNLVIVATDDTTNRTTFPIPLDSIRPSTNYYVRVRYYNGAINSVYSWVCLPVACNRNWYAARLHTSPNGYAR